MAKSLYTKKFNKKESSCHRGSSKTIARILLQVPAYNAIHQRRNKIIHTETQNNNLLPRVGTYRDG